MQVDLLVQPEVQIGAEILRLLDDVPAPNEIIFVSAFATRAALLRFREPIQRLKDQGALIRIVLGIDLKVTTREALQEVYSWKVDARIFKNSIIRHVFHPKIFLCKRDNRADLIVGSCNLTDGGYFGNYECAVLLTYDLANDRHSYEAHLRTLSKFLDPRDPTTHKLTLELLEYLVATNLVPPEAEKRQQMSKIASDVKTLRQTNQASPFKSETIIIPPLPEPIVKEKELAIERERKRRRREGQKAVAVFNSEAEIAPNSFYMALPAMHGKTTPGEARIPLIAVNLAASFWGWPEKYAPLKKKRNYMEWKPRWRVWDSNSPDTSVEEGVRLYFYEESSDFRFYSPHLVKLGANKQDIVQISRTYGDTVEFECVLAHRGTENHRVWQQFCTEKVRNSDRSWGYDAVIDV